MKDAYNFVKFRKAFYAIIEQFPELVPAERIDNSEQ
jgi:hypothetical protein